MLAFTRSLLVIFLLLGIVVGATLYADTIKSFVITKLQTSGSQVLGANTQDLKNNSVSTQVQKEAQNALQSGEKQLMQIKIGDIVNSFTQAQKIVRDVSGLQRDIHQQLQNLAK